VRYHAGEHRRRRGRTGADLQRQGDHTPMDITRTLLDLQESDLSILRLSKELDDMPEKRAILTARAKIADIAKLKERTDEVLRHMDASAKSIEDTIAGVKAKMDAEQARFESGEIANVKELQAVSRELDGLRRRVEQLESQLLGEMQKREDGALQAAKIDGALEEGSRREAELTARFKERGGGIVARIEADKRARSRLAAALPADLHSRYEEVRKTHHGVGVGVLTGSMCGACRVGLPAGKVQALLDGPDIGTCPNCGRLIVVREA
jgi:predicted  nucleic acid-binding Zn-ribbon protein